MIELKNLCKKYGNVTPFFDINAVINDNDIISVIGPSGTGKSTLLRCINMLETPTSGQIIINGIDITAPDCQINHVRKKVGMVFQSFNLFGHLTVLENVMNSPIDLLGIPRQQAYDRAMELLHMVGMDGKAFSYPDMLSGGQKQRAAIARTLAMDPDFILFDEPTSALDPTMVGEVQAVIRELSKMGKGMMIVTHEMKFAREISNRVFYLDQGRIYEEGTPDQIFDNPQKERTRRFVKHLKVFEIDIENDQHDFLDTASELKQYGYKNLLPSDILYKIQSVFEELCQQILLPKVKDSKINFTIEYDEVNAVAKCIAHYMGEKFDPRTTNNTLALKILENRSSDISYEYLPEGEYTNTVEIMVK